MVCLFVWNDVIINFKLKLLNIWVKSKHQTRPKAQKYTLKYSIERGFEFKGVQFQRSTACETTCLDILTVYFLNLHKNFIKDKKENVFCRKWIFFVFFRSLEFRTDATYSARFVKTITSVLALIASGCSFIFITSQQCRRSSC